MAIRRNAPALMKNQSRWDWFLYFADRYTKHGRFDALHLAIWYQFLMLDNDECPLCE